MRLTIKYFKELDFFRSDEFDGELEDARRLAQAALCRLSADRATILDRSNPNGAALAVISSGSDF